MAKYHINPTTGNPGLCRAQAGRCPYGDDSLHYSSRDEAREKFESAMNSIRTQVEEIVSDRGYDQSVVTEVMDMAIHGYKPKSKEPKSPKLVMKNGRPTMEHCPGSGIHGQDQYRNPGGRCPSCGRWCHLTKRGLIPNHKRPVKR